MKNINCRLFSFLSIFAFLIMGCAGQAQAGVNISINFGPPQIVEAAPPEVVMIPQTDIYFVPSISYDVFFYNGYWWSPRGDRWYRASRYNGPWGGVQRSYVPANLYRVPKNYRVVYQKERPIRYGEWKGRKDRGNGNNGRGNKH